MLTAPNRAFYIVAIGIFFNMVTIFFTMPETAYYGSRPSITLPSSEVTKIENSEKTPIADVGETASPEVEISSEVPQQKYIQSLKPWSGSNPNITMKKAFLRPFVLIA
jgi:hypothetical protein